MRDDLHHSLPQTSSWRKVVKAACAPGLDGDLVDTLTRAAWARANWRDNSWGKEFLQVLGTPQGELFGADGMAQKLSSLEAGCPSSDARRALNIALSEISEGVSTADLKDRVVEAALQAGAEDGIEGAVARIADEGQVRQARAKLLAALPKCDLRHQPAPKQRKRKPTVEQSLNTKLDLKGT